MKLNIAYPITGQQKLFEIKEEKRYRIFYDKRISHEVSLDELGSEFVGFVARVTGGNDKQGFPMMQGVLTPNRVRLLLKEGSKCFQAKKTCGLKRKGQMKRKSVRGCVISHEISVLNLIVVKKGAKDIPGLTDEVQKKRLGPKRANNIRKMFNLSKDDDVRKYVVRRKIMKEGKQVGSKAPKIQRLVTPKRIQRKKRQKNIKVKRYHKAIEEAKKYQELLKIKRKK